MPIPYDTSPDLPQIRNSTISKNCFVAKRKILLLQFFAVYEISFVHISLSILLDCKHAIMRCHRMKRALCNLRITQALISLRIRAGWSGPSFSAYRINGYCSKCRRTENVHTRLQGCVRSSGPSLFTSGIRALFLRWASYRAQNQTSRNVRKRIFGHVRPAKNQISHRQHINNLSKIDLRCKDLWEDHRPPYDGRRCILLYVCF